MFHSLQSSGALLTEGLWGTRTRHRLTHTEERNEGRKSAEIRWLLRQARLANECAKDVTVFQICMNSRKGFSGKFIAFSSESNEDEGHDQ